uniref:Uncharacterized protein LOC103337080 isoform X1 n=1 Tax=Rhizophora mucronata TaxID=61149 RepID=A0A2P2LCJ4_RHIMU
MDAYYDFLSINAQILHSIALTSISVLVLNLWED